MRTRTSVWFILIILALFFLALTWPAPDFPLLHPQTHLMFEVAQAIVLFVAALSLLAILWRGIEARRHA